jgi:predicted hydrocarbon binding protein
VHGLIFTGLRRFTWTAFPDKAQGIWDGLPAYVQDEAYPDEEFEDAVRRIADAAGRPREDLLRDFGRFTGFWTFRALRRDYYEGTRSTREFLLGVESRIHEEIRETTPGAAPPRLRVTPLGEDGVTIAYTSERGLCQLLEGLVAGVADYYGERFDIAQPLCMHRGDAACPFVVTPSKTA